MEDVKPRIVEDIRQIQGFFKDGETDAQQINAIIERLNHSS